jgi:hypothetical protein
MSAGSVIRQYVPGTPVYAEDLNILGRHGARRETDSHGFTDDLGTAGRRPPYAREWRVLFTGAPLVGQVGYYGAKRYKNPAAPKLNGNLNDIQLGGLPAAVEVVLAHPPDIIAGVHTLPINLPIAAMAIGVRPTAGTPPVYVTASMPKDFHMVLVTLAGGADGGTSFPATYIYRVNLAGRDLPGNHSLYKPRPNGKRAPALNGSVGIGFFQTGIFKLWDVAEVETRVPCPVSAAVVLTEPQLDLMHIGA